MQDVFAKAIVCLISRNCCFLSSQLELSNQPPFYVKIDLSSPVKH